MGTPILPITVPGDDCPACNPTWYPPYGTPKYITVKFSGMIHCPDETPLPDVTYILTQLPDNPCVWVYEANDIHIEVGQDVSGYVICIGYETPPDGYNLFHHATYDCENVMDNDQTFCTPGWRWAGGTATINFNPAFDVPMLPDPVSLPVYLATIGGLAPGNNPVYDLIETPAATALLSWGSTQTGKGCLILYDFTA